jgi:hypothetical protein
MGNNNTKYFIAAGLVGLSLTAVGFAYKKTIKT